MVRVNVNDTQREALFASALQRSDALTAEAVAEEISRTLRKLGVSGCASWVAQEFGDHPDAACDRMRWARQILDELSPRSGPDDGGSQRAA